MPYNAVVTGNKKFEMCNLLSMATPQNNGVVSGDNCEQPPGSCQKSKAK
jgi:hypothetical protein